MRYITDGYGNLRRMPTTHKEIQRRVPTTFIRKVPGYLCILFLCLHLNACRIAQVLTNQYSENFALATYGTEANHPGLNDGNLQTVATLPATNERHFIIQFADIRPIRKIVIYNENIFRFDIAYLNPETDTWEIFDKVIQRRDLKGKRAQEKYVFDRLNLQTRMIRITVNRTVDDIVINKVTPDPGDKVLTYKRNLGGQYFPHYRVIRPSVAQLREIEVYHLAEGK